MTLQKMKAGQGRPFGIALLLLASVALAACGGDESEQTAETPAAEVPAVPVDGAPAPAAIAGADGAVTHAMVLGEWAPGTAQCAAGPRLVIGPTTLTNTQNAGRSCDILSVELDAGVLTLAGTCTPTPGVNSDVTFAMAAEIVDGAPPTTLEMVQGGNDANGAPFSVPISLVRCAATP